jgi:P27 family predicted phage terminase small subunit
MAKHRKDREIPAITTNAVQEPPQAPERYDSFTKKIFDLLCADLIQRGRLEDVGLHLVELYCDSYMIYKMAMDEIAEIAKLTTKDRKTDRKHPVYHVRRQALDEMLNMEKKLGISPYSRDRISVAEIDDEKDPFDL